MKRYIQKIIVCMIALAMIMGNFAGMGVPVVKATDEEQTILNVIVKDEKGVGISGVKLCLKFDGSSSGMGSGGFTFDFSEVTDSEGKVSFDCSGLLDQNEAFLDAPWYELTLAEGSKYELVESKKIYFDEDFGDLYIAGVGSYSGGYTGEDIELLLKSSGEEIIVEDQFLEGVVKQNDNTLLEKIALEFSRVDLSGTPIKFETDEKGEFKLKINDIKDGVYKLQPALGSGYTYVGGQPMRVEIDTRKEDEKNIKYVSKVDGADHPGGPITLSVSEENSPVITGVAVVTKSVDEKGGKVTLTVTGKNLPDMLYYKKYYVKNGSNGKSDMLLNKETAQPVSAQGEADKKTIEISLPNAQEYIGTLDYSSVTAWKIGMDISADGFFLAGSRSGEIEIKKAPVEQPGDDSNTKDPETPEKPEVPGTSENPGTSEPAKKPETTEKTETTKKPETSKTKEKVTKVSKITISGSSKSIAAGKKIKLTAKVSPAKATNKTVKWKTSNKKYATVDKKGNVTLKKAGAGKTVTITATAADGSGKKATYKIKIMKNSVKSVSLKANKSVKAGKTLKVKATVKTTGKNANKTLKWTSSNTKYATVSAKGVVKAKKAGKDKTVKITAAATDGSNKKKTITIKIK